MDQLILAKDLHWQQIEIYEKKFQLKKALEINAHGLFANMSFKENEVVFNFRTKNIVTKPTYLTVQLDDCVHFSLDPDFLQYMNHSCDPNIFMDTQQLKLIALKPIKKGDELSFFYPSTEWEMEQPFICNCGAANCHSYIGGAHSFKPEVIQQYRLSNYIKRKLSETRQAI
jgi:hypothetical protein